MVASTPALSQTLTINAVQASRPIYGNVAAASNGVTVFRMSPNGAVSVVSGNGGTMASGTRAAARVNVRCQNPNCATATGIVKIGAFGVVGGRANAVSNFTVSSGAATVGMVTVNGDGSIQFPITTLASGTNNTFFVGMDLPILGDDASTATTATAQWTVNVALSPTVPGLPGTTGTATGTVRRSLSVSSTPISFGAIRKPNSGTGTVTINATTGARSVGNGVAAAAGMTFGRGTIVASGQPNTQLTISTPTSFTLSNGVTTLTSTITRSASGTATLHSTTGLYTLGIGGVMSVPFNATTGAYSGVINATLAYN